MRQQQIIKENNMFLLTIIAILLACCQNAIIVTTQQNVASHTGFKCYGNFVAVNFRCLPCQSDQIAQSNRCVKLLGWGYGTNLIQPNSAYIPGLPNCIKAANGPNQACAECKKTYDLVSGKCVEQSCKIFSQMLGKCVDNLKPNQIQSAVNVNVTQINQTQKIPEQIYIVGGPMSKLEIILVDNVIALTLPTMAFKMDDMVLQKTEISTEISSTNQQINQNSIIVSSVPGCANYNKSQCVKCWVGYLLSVLTNQCMQINPSIPLQNKNIIISDPTADANQQNL